MAPPAPAPVNADIFHNPSGLHVNVSLGEGDLYAIFPEKPIDLKPQTGFRCEKIIDGGPEPEPEIQ
jgi:hypothetical protein